ncbi:MAG: hypothetical protein CVU89_02555 [Firmicutes bacterium HGW-Firmicutes-14]|nr:MAG: hypothetical protein CVU89_02555 [Firmicutes bacterium HGW-Firmicutes-14]
MRERKRVSPRERDLKKQLFEKERPALNVKRGDLLKGRIYNVTDEGAFVFTEENHVGYIHPLEQDGPLKKGMVVEARVTFVRADGRVNLSLRPLKETARVVDAEKIVEYMKKRNGSMPFNDSTPPEVIKEKFGISKAAFKRALGKLFREGLIEDREGWITLK